MAKGIKFLGTGSYVPDFIVTNDMFAEFLETSDEWISTRTGIKSRPINTDKPNYYMGVQAAKKAIEQSGISPLDIGLIIVTTVNPDFYFPSMSCLIQHNIGADNAMAIDVNAACTGFIYGVDMARRYLYTDDIDYVLVVSSEMLSNQVNYADRSTAVLFGDGAAATIIARDENKLYSSFLGAKGEDGTLLSCRVKYVNTSPYKNEEAIEEFLGDKFKDINQDFIHMNGREVYKFAVDALPNSVSKACEKVGISPDDIDVLIPHQANLRIIEKAVSNLKIPMEKVFVNLEKHGNTSSASIPTCLDEMNRKGLLKENQKLCFVGFGGGFTYGAVIVEL